MLKRVAAVAVLAALLGGCTDADWDNTLSKVGMSDQPSSPVQAAAPPAAVAPPTDEFCENAAKSAGRESREAGFDDATQRRQAESARKHCLNQ